MSGFTNTALTSFAGSWLSKPVLPAISAMAEAVRARHVGALAVLAYGSCIRGESVRDTLIDFYVLTDDLAGVSNNLASRLGCALVPPNVYYIEHEQGGERLRAKYAVLPLDTFSKWMNPSTGNPYFWARFAQPTVLVYAENDNARMRVTEAISTALATCFGNAKGVSNSSDALQIWTDGFRATYETEWRSERQGRASQIVDTYPAYYAEAAKLLSDMAPIRANPDWRRFTGKLWATARLIKASFTFQGGADYLAWKIERHSGVKIEVTEWQRRHPIIAGLFLLLSLRRKGAIR